MYDSQWPWVELFRALHEYHGTDAYSDLLEQWPEKNPGESRWLADFARRTEGCWGAATDEDLCRLYAVSRVTSTLLLRFQASRADGTDYAGPAISIEGVQLFHEAMGFLVPEPTEFHPFFHEIVRVRQSPVAQTPITVVEQMWPPLMLGNMMFCRAGTAVTGGVAYVVNDVAERSKLYWTFRRKDRPCEDQSHGWGSNSQWRTRFRRDYQSSSAFHYNIDAERPLNSATGTIDGLDVPVMVELVCNRCMVRTAVDDADLYPYQYSYMEVAETNSARAHGGR